MVEILLIIILKAFFTYCVIKKVEQIREQGRVQAYKIMMRNRYRTHFVEGCPLKCHRCSLLCSECFQALRDEEQRREDEAKNDKSRKELHNQ